jgi:tetratricopeptide (TPR) repeat protein
MDSPAIRAGKLRRDLLPLFERGFGVKRTFTRSLAAAALLVCAQSALAVSAVEEAQALVNQGQLDAALKRLDTQLKSSPQDAEARFLRGLVLTRMSRTEEAIKAFADITRDYPQLPEPFNNLAVLYAQQGDYEKARDALEAALATHPSYATAHENLGDIYAALAGAAYNRALMLDQGNTAVRNKLSFINQLSANNTASARGTAPVSTVVPPPPPVTSVPVPPPTVAGSTPATTPPPAPAAPPPPVPGAESLDSATQAAVKSAVDTWAKAWSSKDTDTYFATYAEDFRPEGGISRATWESQRKDRITRPKSIKVGVVKPQYIALGDGRVRVSFLQEYESDSFSDQVNKVLELRDAGGWKIVREYTR